MTPTADSAASTERRWQGGLGERFAGLGRSGIGAVAYLGGIGGNLIDAMGTIGKRPEGALTIAGATRKQLAWLLGAGMPVVGLAHVGMGSFLAMQAYFGATFPEGLGAVVGVGLLRNGAPLLAGFLMAALMARATVELRLVEPAALDADPDWLDDRDAPPDRDHAERPGPSGPRLTLPRVLAAAMAGPPLALWGAMVGLLVGSRVASGILGVRPGVYFGTFAEMLWFRDVLGLVLKGGLFGIIGAAAACHEGLRRDGVPAPTAAVRAACVAMAMILFGNLAWFFFAYLAGPAFGPTVLTI